MTLTTGEEYEYQIIAQNNLGMKSDSRSVSVTAPIALMAVLASKRTRLEIVFPQRGAHQTLYRRSAAGPSPVEASCLGRIAAIWA